MQLQKLESLKARFLKQILGISKYDLSRHAYLLEREAFLIDD